MTWTRGVVSDALRGARRLAHCEYEIFLQGSFANNTHISPTSDVDVVVMMTMPLEEDVVALDTRGRKNFDERYESSTYDWKKFRADVVRTMRERYFVGEGKRCLDIKHWDSMVRVPADVLPAIEYRHYRSFMGPGLEDYKEGVYFCHRNGTPIINYPKQHRINGDKKARATSGRSKEVVRIVKNSRDHLAKCECRSVGERDLMNGVPSYYLECLVHNVPNGLFRGSPPHMMCAIFAWLVDRSETTDWSRQKCQNGIVDLFGTGPDQWDPSVAGKAIEALRRFFDEPVR